jgi:hypothetical protein
MRFQNFSRDAFLNAIGDNYHFVSAPGDLNIGMADAIG